MTASTAFLNNLVGACLSGNSQGALQVLDQYCVNINTAIPAYLEGIREIAPPLWWAAATGQNEVVDYLIRNGAFLNCFSNKGSTPLYMACYYGHVAIIENLIRNRASINLADKTGHTCLMIACLKGNYNVCKYLVACGAAVNQTNSIGKTALHFCSETANFEIMEMLFRHGAIFTEDKCATSPLMAAAISGQYSVVKYFFQRFTFPKQDKMNAVELIGATLVEQNRNIEVALECWRLAERYRAEDPAFPWVRPAIISPIARFENVEEVHSLAELNELSTNRNGMRTQSMLIRERILGPGHPETGRYIKQKGLEYLQNGDYYRFMYLWLYVVDNFQARLAPLSIYTQNTLEAFVQTLSEVMSNPRINEMNANRSVVTINDLLHIFQRSLKELRSGLEMSYRQNEEFNKNFVNYFHRIIVITLYVVRLMCELRPNLSEAEDAQLIEAVSVLVRIDPRSRYGCSLLHLACAKDTSPIGREFHVHTFPSPGVVNLLLQAGAHVTPVDCYNNTPLHTSSKDTPAALEVFKVLLNHGAHLDLRNGQDKSPLEFVQSIPLSDVCPLRYLKLQCLCSQTIRKNNIPYKGLIHKRLEDLVDHH